MNQYYIYTIINKLNNKLYIGVTSNPERRWYQHKLIAKKGKIKNDNHFQPIHKAISKYGENNFEFNVILENKNELLCYEIEKKIILEFKKNKIKLYNIAEGGRGTGSGKNHPMYGKKLPMEWKEKVKFKLIERYKNNPELKNILKDKLEKRNWKGENHPMYGKKHTKETKNKISNSCKNKIVSSETKNKISIALKGRKIKDETKNKISKIKKNQNKGIKNPNYGNKWSDEQKANFSKKKKGTINLKQRKFNDKQVYEILNLKYNKKIILKKIAEKFKCGLTTIKQIVYGKYYQDCFKRFFNDNS